MTDFLVYDSGSYLLGQMTVNAELRDGGSWTMPHRMRPRAVSASPNVVPTSATMPAIDRTRFDIRAVNFYDPHGVRRLQLCADVRDASHPNLVDLFVERFPSFTPNVFYAPDIREDVTRISLPDVTVRSDLTSGEVRLCEERRGMETPIVSLTHRQWSTHPTIQAFRERTRSAEEEALEHRLTMQRMEEENRKNAQQKKAEKARALKAEIAKTKNALRVVRKVNLD